MARSQENLDQALQALVGGDSAALTPEQVARLERVLNSERVLAEQVAELVPPRDVGLTAALQELDRTAQPAPQDWERVWERINAAAPGAVRRTVGRIPARVLRFWQPLAAAAACLLLVIGWRLMPVTADEPWPMQLASNVEISDIEVSEGSTPFVFQTGGESGIEIIWVLEDHS